MTTQTTVIHGGGFGGIAAANTLRRLAPKDHAIVVVDRTPRFYVGAGKTWIALGERTFEQISQARSALLDAGVRFLEADVTAIDVANRKVVTSAETLAWVYLVIALGADVNEAGLPWLAEAAHTFYSVAGAERLTDREKAWRDFAGWRVNYDRALVVLCWLVMTPRVMWSSDRAPVFKVPPLLIFRNRLSAGK